jgi:hypothetical protein
VVDPFFPIFFKGGDLDGLAVQQAKGCFSDAVKFEERIFPAGAT